jgi:hypothetical protein
MRRTSKSTGFFTFVGMMMTLVGIFLCLFFLFAPLTFGATSPDSVVNSSPDLQLSMRWIQPILGQAIVEDALIKQQYSSERIKSSNRIQRQSPGHADAMRIDHAALVQWVMGRLIVELTSHRMESGLAAPDQFRDETNQRIMTILQQAGRQFDEILRAEGQTKSEGEVVTAPRTSTVDRLPDELPLIF